MLTIKKTKFVLAMMMCLILGTAFAQQEDDSLTKKEQKKQARQQQYAENLKVIKNAVADSSFVIEANMIRGRYSFNNFVSPNTNFVKVEGKKVVIQTANSFGVGYNGLGGITITGDINKYEVFKDKNGVQLTLNISSPVLGFSTMNISVNASGSATAMLRTGYGGYANFTGDLYRLDESSTYEGISIL